MVGWGETSQVTRLKVLVSMISLYVQNSSAMDAQWDPEPERFAEPRARAWLALERFSAL